MTFAYVQRSTEWTDFILSVQIPTTDYITVSDSALFACTVLLIDNVPQDNNKTSFVLRSKLSICFFLRAFSYMHSILY